MLRVVACLVAVVLVTAVKDFQWFRTSPDCKDVMTEAGLVRGCPGPRNAYMAWLGVPYAAPPTGTYRFKPPSRPFRWNGIFDANRIVKCPQFNGGNEDCLVVNIFSPTRIFDGPLPVLVYIHGGYFIMGQGQVQGVDQLMNQNIIVVTVNYRLGALGFLCLGIEDAPGNAGLKDQIAALRWVQRNIANFGGDPKNVTIYGMSAGGASVEMLVLSKQTEGLFKQAIVESGSATAVWTVDSNPIQTALNFASKLKIPTKKINVYALANYYQRTPAKVLAKTNWEYFNNLTDGTFGFVPCIERTSLINESEAVLTESPYDTLVKENYKKVPMMFLYSSVEGLFLRSEEYYKLNYKERMTENFLDFLPADLQFDTPEIAMAMADNICDFYFGNRTIGEDIMDYLKYFGDYLILHGLLNSAQIHSRGDNPVYLMEFAYKGSMGSYDKFYQFINLAGHGDVMKHAILKKRPVTAADSLAVARITKMIANFVKFGNPTPERTHILPILWPRVYPKNVSALHMDQEFRVVEEPRWFSKEFWDGLYCKYRRKIMPVDVKDHNYTFSDAYSEILKTLDAM